MAAEINQDNVFTQVAAVMRADPRQRVFEDVVT